MQLMPLNPTVTDILIRLALACVAGAIIGFNREAHSHTAGLRTTMLVGLAATVSMILANILVTTNGKEPTSFVNFDPMRLPLGILTGVGFIGGGAILKRGPSITGVTTAATLWIMTAIGLCFGAGLLELGSFATFLGFFILWGMKWVEQCLPRKQIATLVLLSPTDIQTEELNRLIGPMGYRARFWRWSFDPEKEQRKIWFRVQWQQVMATEPSREFLKKIENVYKIGRFELMRHEE